MFKLTAPLKDYIWGGTKLKTEFGKQTDMPTVAESWELSCHKDGQSVIVTGEHAGKTLSDYLDANKQSLGLACDKFDNFPILIKLIDANDNLSVQVHPNNEYALRVEGEYGKTEMWYIVDCAKDASLLYGFTKQISKDEFKKRIEDNTLLEVCNKVPVKKGDVFFIEAGTLHAIGAGIVIAEIQQNSNTTYRIYDYGRVGVDGKPRELHVDKAIEVTERDVAIPYPVGSEIDCDGYTKKLLSSCEYFTVNALSINGNARFNADATSFHSLLCLSGEVKVGELTLTKGESLFVPANNGEYTLSGNAKIIMTTID